MKVMLAMPCYAGAMTVAGYQSIHGIGQALTEVGVDSDFLITSGESAITRGRSNMAATFLKSDCDVLAFLDADIFIKPEDFLTLLALEKPVRGAAVSTKTMDFSESLSVYKDGKRVARADMPGEPFEVDYIGGSVMLIERQTLLMVYTNYPELAYVDPIVGEGVHVFGEIVEDGTLLSEDYAFCHRVRQCGLTIWCDPSIVVSHFEGRVAWRH